MQILFDLIHSLAKEEKRLYYLHRRENRFHKIYEAYLKAPCYNKTLDQNIFAENFTDVSRAFYSMLKRSLMDDVLTVLLEYSNNQDSAYQFHRLYARSMVLLEREMGEAATAYLEEAHQLAATQTQPEYVTMAIRGQKRAIAQAKVPSLKTFERLYHLEAELAERERVEELVQNVKSLLILLRINADEEGLPAIRQKADRYIQLLNDAKLKPENASPRLQLDILEAENNYHIIAGVPDVYHRKLVQRYNAVTRDSSLPEPYYHKLINRVLNSAIRCGDFLLLTSLVYKLAKEVNLLDAETRHVFLPDYMEVRALFYFYENDLPQALKEIAAVINLENVEHKQLVRCIFYRLALLLAAHLPLQALEEIRFYSARVPELADNPLMWLIEVVFAIELHQEADEILFLIERRRNQLRKRPSSTINRQIVENLTALAAFLEHKRTRDRLSALFPEDWEPILRIDLWLRAKQETKFYYNLMLEDWQLRRRVF